MVPHQDSDQEPNTATAGAKLITGIKALIKAHGRSMAPAVLGALSAARNFIAGEGVEQIREELGKELH